jgi:hypothetical protein
MIAIFLYRFYENRKSFFRNAILAGLIVESAAILLNSSGTYKILKTTTNLLIAKNIPKQISKK